MRISAWHTLPLPTVDQETRSSEGSAGDLWHRVPRPSLGVLIVGAVVLAIAMVGLWPTFSYRQAVHSVHSDIKSVDLGNAELVEQRVQTCWNGVAPASITILRPADSTDVVEIVAGFRADFEALGYVSEAPTAHTRPQRWTRERDDDLDFDVIELTYLPDTGDLQIIGDVYDIDMVFCPPF